MIDINTEPMLVEYIAKDLASLGYILYTRLHFARYVIVKDGELIKYKADSFTELLETVEMIKNLHIA